MAIPGDIIRATVKYTALSASAGQNVFIWTPYLPIATNEALLDFIEDWVDDVWAVQWDGLAVSTAMLTSVEVNIMNPDGTVLEALGERVINHAGGAPGTSGPAATSGYLQAQTELPKVYGRKYVPFMSTACFTNGVFSATYTPLLDQLLTEWLTGVYGGITPILRPGVISTSEVAYVPFNGTGYYTNVPAVQRRRKPGVGE